MNIPTIDLVQTGANIVKLHKAAGLSVHDLQLAFGFNSPQAIYKWQNGTTLPTVDNLLVLAAILQVRIDDFNFIIMQGLRSLLLVRSSKRKGHSPFKAAMLGSNPARITIRCLRLTGQDASLSSW